MQRCIPLTFFCSNHPNMFIEHEYKTWFHGTSLSTSYSPEIAVTRCPRKFENSSPRDLKITQTVGNDIACIREYNPLAMTAPFMNKWWELISGTTLSQQFVGHRISFLKRRECLWMHKIQTLLHFDVSGSWRWLRFHFWNIWDICPSSFLAVEHQQVDDIEQDATEPFYGW